MKVLFAVNNENISEAIIKKYQKNFGELLEYKNVYYYNAIIKELERTNDYDRLVIYEDLEIFSSKDSSKADNFVMEKLKSIEGGFITNAYKSLPILFICNEKRKKGDAILTDIFNANIYDILVEKDRTITKICELINSPRNKKQATEYLGIKYTETKPVEKEKVKQSEINSIIRYYKKNMDKKEEYSKIFDSIVPQYNNEELEYIIGKLPQDIVDVLSKENKKFQEITKSSKIVDIKSEKKDKKEDRQKTEKTKNVATKITKIFKAPIETNKEQEVVIESKDQLEKEDEPSDEVSKEDVIIPKKIKLNKTPEKITEKEEIPVVEERKNDHIEDDFSEIFINPIVDIEDNQTVEKKPVQEIAIKEKDEPSDANDEIFIPLVNDEVQDKKEEKEPIEIEILPDVEEDLKVEAKPEEKVEVKKEKLEQAIKDTVNTVIAPSDVEPSSDSGTIEKNENNDMTSFLSDILDEDDDRTDVVDLDLDFDADDEKEIEIEVEPKEKLNIPDKVEEIKVEKDVPKEPVVIDYKPEEVKREIPKKTENEFSEYNKVNPLTPMLSRDKKIVIFVGTSKNGTSFLINSLGMLFASVGINTAILDMTKNKNSYYLATNNDEKLRKIAVDSIKNLEQDIAMGLMVARNLTVYTSIPGEGNIKYNQEKVLATLAKNYSVVLIDSDFETDPEYFALSQEIYLVQSLDILTMQPLTAFLKQLKEKNILTDEKVRIVINKEMQVKGLTKRLLVGGLSTYNNPSMSIMKKLFDRNRAPVCSIPFDMTVCSKYLENIVECKFDISGYPKRVVESLKILANMVYPLISKQRDTGFVTAGNIEIPRIMKNRNSMEQPNSMKRETLFTSGMSNTLEQMKNRNK